ncbi:uncharacterized protein LOC111005006 isoform X2 [Momordica charantia]|uniref:Uncharacterized protein LOC111005006 isoform X2 n=1 Tax=Momordica charantia TaxID=3673 RepID=A0A6J1BRY1_MOMCH|nr:uncharacterized protein LOC111005006 isoform X2 [Momordica charantia]
MLLLQIAECEEKRMIRELALLFDACDLYVNKNGDSGEGNSQRKSISERFMAMRAAILTNNSSAQHFGSELGASLLRLDELMQTNHLGLPPVDFLATELLKKLGFQDGKIQDSSEFDLLFVHVGVGDKVNDEKDKTTLDEIKYVDALVGDILQKAQPGSEIGSRLHLSLVMSYGNIFKDDDCSLSVLNTKDVKNSDLSVLFPRQSYTMKGEIQRNDVRHHSPMLAAQWQYGVTRKDKAETFSFKEFKEQGSNLVIPADRFIHEVAFKLWKAPKYGA